METLENGIIDYNGEKFIFTDKLNFNDFESVKYYVDNFNTHEFNYKKYFAFNVKIYNLHLTEKQKQVAYYFTTSQYMYDNFCCQYFNSIVSNFEYLTNLILTTIGRNNGHLILYEKDFTPLLPPVYDEDFDDLEDYKEEVINIAKILLLFTHYKEIILSYFETFINNNNYIIDDSEFLEYEHKVIKLLTKENLIKHVDNNNIFDGYILLLNKYNKENRKYNLEISFIEDIELKTLESNYITDFIDFTNNKLYIDFNNNFDEQILSFIRKNLEYLTIIKSLVDWYK